MGENNCTPVFLGGSEGRECLAGRTVDLLGARHEGWVRSLPGTEQKDIRSRGEGALSGDRLHRSSHCTREPRG